jgi:hypothetical protein
MEFDEDGKPLNGSDCFDEIDEEHDEVATHINL